MVNLSNCHNIANLRQLARQRLPKPVFDYIDGGSDDETTLRNNTAAFDACDLIPSVLRNTANVDLSVNLFGHRLEMPLYCSPTALQRLFHVDGEHAVAAAAQKFSTLFGVSSLTTVPLAEIAAKTTGPKIFQFYYHRDRSLNEAMLAQAREYGFDILALTVDTATGGNRERDLRSGFTSPIRLTTRAALSFALHPRWAFEYYAGPKFDLPLLSEHVSQGSQIAVTVGDYFSTMLEPTLNWEHVRQLRRTWDGPFCLKGVMSVDDARRAAELGLDGVIISNHGGRQLDGCATPFGQLASIVDAVGHRMEVICDGGIRRGSHVVKALAMGASACSGGRFYLYGLAGAGQTGVEKALSLMRDEIKRAMILMGKRSVGELDRHDLGGLTGQAVPDRTPPDDIRNQLTSETQTIKRGRMSRYAGKKIRKLVDTNPHRKNTLGWKSFNVIENNMTYEEFVARGGRLRDLDQDIKKGHIVVHDQKK